MIVQGNSFRLAMADNSIHVVASSFPYWGLRDYSLKPLVFGGRDDCRHEWVTKTHNPNPHGDNGTNNSGLDGGKATQAQTRIGEIESAFCIHCNAWRGSFGLEPTMDLHIKHAVMVCREIKRVLRPDGIFWLNYGDSYATGKNGRSAADGKALGNDDRTFRDKPFSTANEVRAKNLCMIPQKVAIALQADGWIIRSAPPWVKRNPMPESVQDRPGTGHEYVYMLVKSDRYFWDMEGVRKTAAVGYNGSSFTNGKTAKAREHLAAIGQGERVNQDGVGGRALRTSDFFFDSLDSYIAHLQDIRDNGGLMLEADGSPAAFVVNPRGYKFAHYATWPVALVAPMIRAATSDKGVCPKCGKQWVRVVEKQKPPIEVYTKSKIKPDAMTRAGFPGTKEENGKRGSGQKLQDWLTEHPPTTTGWHPSCSCDAGDPIPAIILDPFAGSGATGQAANELGRRFIGVDLNPSYLALNALPRSEGKTSQAALEMLPMFAL